MTMLVHGYESKKALRAAVGKELNYEETSWAGEEYRPNGSFTVAARPGMSRGVKREFYAKVTMRDGLIAKVE